MSETIKEGEGLYELILKAKKPSAREEGLHFSHVQRGMNVEDAVYQAEAGLVDHYVVAALSKAEARALGYIPVLERPAFDEQCERICASPYGWPRRVTKGKPRREPDHAPFWWDLPSVTEDNAAALGESFMDVVRKMSGDTK